MGLKLLSDSSIPCIYVLALPIFMLKNKEPRRSSDLFSLEHSSFQQVKIVSMLFELEQFEKYLSRALEPHQTKARHPQVLVASLLVDTFIQKSDHDHC